MTISAAHIAPTDDDLWGRHVVTFLKVTMDSSYASSGGETIDFKAYAPGVGVGTGQPIFVAISPEGAAAEGYVWSYDYANKKILAFRQKDPAAVGGADTALPEVTAAVDLSAVDLRVLVVWG